MHLYTVSCECEFQIREHGCEHKTTTGNCINGFDILIQLLYCR